MRYRLFFFNLVVLVLVVVLSLAIHAQISRKERIKFIDQQIRETANALLDSEINGLTSMDFESINTLISKELGHTRIGKFFILRDGKNQVFFGSKGVQFLPLDLIDPKQEWINIEQDGQFIRALTTHLPKTDNHTLQVGVIMRPEMIAPAFFNSVNMLFFVGLVFFGMFISWVLTSTLMRPLRSLSDQVLKISSLAESSRRLSRLESQSSEKRNRDELQLLINGLNILVDRVNRSYETSQAWIYQIAHELKTPLALISATIETAEMKEELKSDLSTRLKREVFSASETVTEFLVWAEAENTQSGKSSHVTSLKKMLEDLSTRLQIQAGNRILIRNQNDFQIITHKPYLELMLINLIRNALSYSPQNQTVEIIIDSPHVVILDRGPGISDTVLSKLGEPFNRGTLSPSDGSKNHGLGLAVVQAISRKLNVVITYKIRKNEGTAITLAFDPLNDSENSLTLS